MPELTESAIRNIITLAVGLGAVMAAFKGFFSAKSSVDSKPSATNESLAGMIRAIDQKIDIFMRNQDRHNEHVGRAIDRHERISESNQRELIEINTRLENR